MASGGARGEATRDLVIDLVRFHTAPEDSMEHDFPQYWEKRVSVRVLVCGAAWLGYADVFCGWLTGWVFAEGGNAS